MSRFLASFKFLGFVVSAGCTGLIAWLGVNVPADPNRMAQFQLGVRIICVIGFLALVVIGAIDFIQARLREAVERERDESIKQILGHIVPQDLSQPGPKLRQAGFDLAKDMRGYLASVPDGLSREAEFEFVYPYFLSTYFPRLSAIKDRFEVVLPKWTVVSPAEWLPTNKDQIRKIATNLEQEAQRVPEDVLS